MSDFNTAYYKSAAPSYHDFDLSGTVVSTHDFGIPYRPVFCREVVPGDKWDIELSCFTRLASMALPTFGRCHILNRFFYVPCNIIHGAWNEFMSGQDISDLNAGLQRVSPSIPYITNKQLVELFFDGESLIASDPLADPTSTSWYDFALTVNGTVVKMLFTEHGRIFYNILLGLGYSINWSLSDTTQMSALPLIAYHKIAYDWLVDSAFVNSIDFDVQGLFTYTGGQITNNYLAYMTLVFASCYEKDYLTSAWQSPNQVDSSSYGNPFKASVPGWNSGSTGSLSLANNDNGSTSLSTATLGGGVQAISQYGLNVLESISSFVRKRLFTGFRQDKQLESQFNLKLDPEIANRCYYIGTVDVPVQISDVMATATTSDAILGEYAGKGIGYENGKFHFEPKNPEVGFLICVSAVVPEVHYCQGRSRELFHLNRHDFYCPEFEEIGPQAIRNDEVFARYTLDTDYTAGQNYGGNPSKIFGYAPRYAEYKCGHITDKLLGDYNFYKENGSGVMNAFHFYRLFEKPSPNKSLANSYYFKTTEDANQFQRVFTEVVGSEHFNIMYDFKVHVQRLMLPLNSLPDIKGYGKYIKQKHMDDLLPG